MPEKTAYRLSTAVILAFAMFPNPVRAQGCTGRFETLKGLSGLDSGFNARPVWADLDDDSDLDLVAGDFDGQLRTFENVGLSSIVILSPLGGASNPFATLDVGQDSAPAFGDLDGDGDLDLVVGRNTSGLTFLENIGTAAAPSFILRTGAADPFDGLDLGTATVPSFADLDNDTDFDGVVGLGNGTLAYLRNDGTATVPAFVLVGGGANPLAGVSYSVPRPWLADLDDDGDLDLTVGQQLGHYAHMVNIGTTLAPSFSPAQGGDDPIGGVNVGSIFAHPALADLDSDGDLDAAVFGSAYAAFVENAGSNLALAFIERFAGANPLESNVPPLRPGSGTFVDLDGDGDFDLAGEQDSAPPRYWENTGTPIAPSWIERTGAANPFAGVAAQPDDIFSPELADLDGDGDFDLAVARGGSIDFYWNTGSATTPTFVQQTGVANPFNGLLGQYLTLGDFDGDGDLDGVAGSDSGGLRYFRNSGSPTAVVLAELIGPASPLASVEPGSIDEHTRPALADLDADLVFGERSGGLLFYRSTCVVFADGFESGGTSRWTLTVP